MVACSGGASSSAVTPATPAIPAASPSVERFLLTNLETLGEIDATGRVTQQLAELEQGRFFRYPALSPDGSQIGLVILAQTAGAPGSSVDFGADLYLCDRDGSNLKELVHHEATAEFVEGVVWLDDHTLAYGFRGRNGRGALDLRIESYDLTTGQRTRLIDNATVPALSADRQTSAYVAINPADGSEAVVAADATLANPRTIVPAAAGLFGISSLTPSADGSRIAFAARDLLIPTLTPLPGTGIKVGLDTSTHPDGSDVWIVNRDGSGLHKIFEPIQPNLSIAWSEDGRSLYVVAPSGIWQVDPDSGKNTQIGDGLQYGQIVPIDR